MEKQDQFIFVGYLLLSIFVIGTLIYKINSVAGDESFEMRLNCEEFASIIGRMLNFDEGNLEFRAKLVDDVGDFFAGIEDGNVVIRYEGEWKCRFFDNDKYKIDVVKERGYLVFRRVGVEMGVENEEIL